MWGSPAQPGGRGGGGVAAGRRPPSRDTPPTRRLSCALGARQGSDDLHSAIRQMSALGAEVMVVSRAAGSQLEGDVLGVVTASDISQNVAAKPHPGWEESPCPPAHSAGWGAHRGTAAPRTAPRKGRWRLPCAVMGTCAHRGIPVRALGTCARAAGENDPSLLTAQVAPDGAGPQPRLSPAEGLGGPAVGFAWGDARAAPLIGCSLAASPVASHASVHVCARSACGRRVPAGASRHESENRVRARQSRDVTRVAPNDDC